MPCPEDGVPVMVARKPRTQKQRKVASTAPTPVGGTTVPPAGGVAGVPPVPLQAPPPSPLISEEYQRRLNEGRKRALKEGKVLFRPPFGYKVADGKLVVDEEKRALVINILEHLDHEWPPRLISEKFGIPSSAIRRIRNNPIYRTGEVRYAGEVVFKVEPILQREKK